MLSSRELSGGLSGAKVYLVWPEDVPALILKVDDTRLIENEFTSRRLLEYDDRQLEEFGAGHLAQVGAIEDVGADLSAIAYSYFGAIRYQDLDKYANIEDLIQKYLPVGRFTREQLARCFDVVAAKLATPAAITESALPLREYLPSPDWDRLSPILGVISQIDVEYSWLASLRDWFESQIDRFSLAPYPDKRRLHGDPRLANILVNRISSEVEFIDFGGSTVGHPFRDIARFEVDLLLRASSWSVTPAKRSEDFAARLRRLIPPTEMNQSADSDVVLLWRASLNRVFPGLAEIPTRQMLMLFLGAEMLKRLLWITVGSERDVGGRSVDLIEGLAVVRAFLDGLSIDIGDTLTQQNLREILGIRRVFVPLPGSERVTNNVRNEAKLLTLQRAITAKSRVCLVAETGNSYLHTRGPFFASIEQLLSRGGRFDVLLVQANEDQQDPTRIRKFDESIEGAKHLAGRYSSRLRVGVLEGPLLATVLLSEDVGFFEPYFEVDRARREKLLFDTFEVEFSSRNSQLYALLAEQFETQFRRATVRI
ncbi:MAG: phosphotransferase [Actinomycetota bacterium]